MTAGNNRSVGVVMLTPNFHPYVGGAEKQALELSKTLRRLGVRVRVLTRAVANLRSEETVEGIPVHRVFAPGSGLLNALCFILSSLRFLLCRSSEYQIIHVHLAGSPALAACCAGAILGKRVVVKVGGGRGIGEIALSSKTFLGRLKLALLRRFGPVFITVTRDLKEEMEELGMGGAGIVIPNGVDTARYRPAAGGEKRELRASLGWPEGLCFLYVGRFAPEKRLGDFLEVFAQAAPPAFFVLAGYGPEEKGLRARAKGLRLGDRVRFLPPSGEVERLYRAADVFVLPSVSEGLSNALLEAMSAGLAVLASRVGGTREVVSHGKTGILFEPAEKNGMREGVARYLSTPGLAAEFGAAARSTAEESYSIERVAKRYMEVYG